jgi:hypothetical protein
MSTAISVRTEQLLGVLHEIEAWGSRHDWSGTDPYDGLNATRLVGPLRGSALGRRLIIQAVKRSPLDLRPVLGVRPATNATTLAWVASAYARGGFLSREESRIRLEHTLSRLVDLRRPGMSEACWGYHFDMQSRVFFYPRGSPNTIATAFAGMALLDAYERTGDERWAEVATEAGEFFLRHVPQTPDPPGAFFGYLPDDRSPIHNSNTHVCALLARLGSLAGEDRYRDAARSGIEWTVARQRADGSWPYGERPNLQWIDNFHTGYVLDALRTCADSGFAAEIGDALERGLQYYRRELVLDDGTPKYYASSVYPIDMQCVAQSIQTFAIAASREPSWADTAWSVFSFALDRMRRSDGLFVFQRRRMWKNRRPYPRAVVGPMMLALANLLAYEQRGSSTVMRDVRDSGTSSR